MQKSLPSLVFNNLNEFDTRTLLIHGANDTVIPISSSERLEHIIKSAELKIIPDCGHIPHMEKPRETAQILNQFLTALNSD